MRMGLRTLCSLALSLLSACGAPRDRAYPEMHSPVTLLRYEGNLLELGAEPELSLEESVGRAVLDLAGRPVRELWVKVSVTNRGPGRAGLISDGCPPAAIRAYRSPARTGPPAWTSEQYTPRGCLFQSGRHDLAPGETVRPEAFQDVITTIDVHYKDTWSRPPRPRPDPPEPGRYYLSVRADLHDEHFRFAPDVPGDGLPPLRMLPRVDTVRVPAGSADLSPAWSSPPERSRVGRLRVRD